MSDEPFALSTIPPALPAEGDYDALRAAVMDSARGRWFLGEYARRNRQADTQAVLAAIERIEAVIRGERNQHAYQNVRTDLLEMARAIAQTRAEVATATAGTAAREPGAQSDSATAPTTPPDIFTTAERMQEVAWTMRERGIDHATCAQIEALAASILSASSLRDPGDQRAQQLGEVLHYLERRIDTMLDNAALAALAALAADAAAAGAVSADTPRDDEPDRQALHSGNGLDETHQVIGPPAEEVEPAPAAAAAEDFPQEPFGHAAELQPEPAGAILPEAAAAPFETPAATEFDSLARHDDVESAAPGALEPALDVAPVDIDPLIAAPVEDLTANTGGNEEPLHPALELKPLLVEPLFEKEDAGATAEPHTMELSAPAAAEPTEPSAPIPVTTVGPDALIYIADEGKAEPAAPAPPELFFPAVTFDTAPAAETAAIVHERIVQERPAETEDPAMPALDFDIGSQVQSDLDHLDDLVALPAETEPQAATPDIHPSAVIELPAVNVSAAASEPSASDAEPHAPTPPAAPVEPAREIDVLSAAWESAVTYPSAATPSHTGTAAAAAAAPGDYLPSMWEAPLAASSAALQTSEPEPADFLLEPLSMSAYANEPATALASAPPQEPADAMREIEEELFAPPPMQAGAAAIPTPAAPAAEVPILQSPATPSAAAAQFASGPAVAGGTGAIARPAARTMPRPARNDPLAALNAMSDEERIALFS